MTETMVTGHSQRNAVMEELQERSPGSKLIFFAQTGSRAYGTHREDSDWDFKGVYMAPLEKILGIGKQPGNLSMNSADDCTLYELSHFAKLAASANPTVLELLWSPWTWRTMEGLHLLAARDIFLSRRLQFTYGGYAKEQMRHVKAGSGGSRGVSQFKREKFVLHTLRLLDAGVSALREGYIPVAVKNPELLRSTAAGLVDDVDLLEKVVERKVALIDSAASKSKLPQAPDFAKVDALLYHLRVKEN